MRFKVEFGMNTAAFAPHPADELVDILDKLTARVQRDGLEFDEAIHDSNGNYIGAMVVIKEEDDGAPEKA